jgi:hypothetical protein
MDSVESGKAARDKYLKAWDVTSIMNGCVTFCFIAIASNNFGAPHEQDIYVWFI